MSRPGSCIEGAISEAARRPDPAGVLSIAIGTPLALWIGFGCGEGVQAYNSLKQDRGAAAPAPEDDLQTLVEFVVSMGWTNYEVVCHERMDKLTANCVSLAFGGFSDVGPSKALDSFFLVGHLRGEFAPPYTLPQDGTPVVAPAQSELIAFIPVDDPELSSTMYGPNRVATVKCPISSNCPTPVPTTAAPSNGPRTERPSS